jgi:hypothetical protein
MNIIRYYFVFKKAIFFFSIISFFLNKKYHPWISVISADTSYLSDEADTDITLSASMDIH